MDSPIFSIKAISDYENEFKNVKHLDKFIELQNLMINTYNEYFKAKELILKTECEILGITPNESNKNDFHIIIDPEFENYYYKDILITKFRKYETIHSPKGTNSY